MKPSELRKTILKRAPSYLSEIGFRSAKLGCFELEASEGFTFFFDITANAVIDGAYFYATVGLCHSGVRNFLRSVLKDINPVIAENTAVVVSNLGYYIPHDRNFLTWEIATEPQIEDCLAEAVQLYQEYAQPFLHKLTNLRAIRDFFEKNELDHFLGNYSLPGVYVLLNDFDGAAKVVHKYFLREHAGSDFIDYGKSVLNYIEARHSS